MRKYKSYIRAIALSILAAFLIDGVINFEEYKEGFVAGMKNKQEEKTNYTNSKVPAQLGKVSAIALGLMLGR